MKIVIAGSRKYNDYAEAKEYIDECVRELEERETVILSGGCSGADMLGEKYAEERGYEVERIDAEWSKFGKAAGPIRNRIMAEKCDALICFWDGNSSGTGSMIECARKANKKVYIKFVEIL